MPNFIFTKNKKQHLTQHEVFDKIWTILVVLRLAIMIVYGIVIQILHPPWIPFGFNTDNARSKSYWDSASLEYFLPC
jgi:uncharacterized BrkB/YihY/UPF0761 family membrane protein